VLSFVCWMQIVDFRQIGNAQTTVLMSDRAYITIDMDI
jgi:hypothetical protein